MINRDKLYKINQKVPLSQTVRFMREITEGEYKKFLQAHNFVMIENVKVPLIKEHIIEEFEPKDFKLETTTVWSFPERGEWATHKGNYRANWSPYIPRNLILR